MILGIAISFGACAPTAGLLRTQAGYDDVFRGCAQAVAASGFSVRSSDINTGVISGELQKGELVYQINVAVRRAQAGVEVEASVRSSKGGGLLSDRYFNEFIKALNKQIHDVNIVSVQ